MNRQRLFRGLRIAWTVGFGIVSLSLALLCVRSYWWLNQAQLVMSKDKVLVGMSVTGTLAVAIHDVQRPLVSSLYSAKMTDEERNQWPWQRWSMSLESSAIYFPHWFAMLVFATLSALPWAPRRFSVRTLLILTTVVAVFLGLGVYFARQ